MTITSTPHSAETVQDREPDTSRGVSRFRLYLLRGGYLLIALAMGSEIWPLVFHHRAWSDVMHGVAVSMLAALTALCLLGVRYPLKMLPLLFFEIAWKTIWLTAMAWPLWATGRMDAAASQTAFACALGAIYLLIMPWGYVWRHYVTAPGDRWR
jgi:hypothetical protein